jgi:acetyl-CoA acetyltransferase family protein
MKSSFVSLIVVILVMVSHSHEAHALVLRKVANTLRDSVYAQYMWAIEKLGVTEYWEAKKTPMELIFKPTGQKIMFRGADDPMKIKSIKAPFGYIAVTHFEELDQFAVNSQNKTEVAQAAGKFEAEIVPVMVKKKKDLVEFKVDEYPKAGVTMESVSKLKGAFPLADGSKGNRVTAANASGINDGAAAIVLASKEAVEKYGLKPMAKLVSWGQGGVDPKVMGLGPVPASRQALAKAELTIEDIDLVEANEAFAAQSVAVARDLGFDMAKVNVNGGAISIGHPVGCSGARIIVTLLHEMMKRDDAKKGLATLCIGGGMGVATIWEKC